MKKTVRALLVAAIVCALSLVWALRTKDYFFVYSTHLNPDECFWGHDDPIDTTGLREGRPAPESWARNERLDRLVIALQTAKDAYPAQASACTSNRRVLAGLGWAAAILVLLAGFLSLRKARRARMRDD